MGTTSQSEHVLSEFFITASKVSEVAARGLQDALRDAPKCHFEILQKQFWKYALKSLQFMTSRMPIHNFSPSISLRFTNQ